MAYSVEIIETSKELTAKERIQIKDTTDAIKLGVATQVEPVIIDPDFYATLLVHNDKSDDKEYSIFVLVDKNGTRYITGSESFWSAFLNIYMEMKNNTEPWQIKAYRMPSKNRQGNDFITCSLV